MGRHQDRILIVEHNPEISDLIGRQTLQSLGYQVQIVGDATVAIPRINDFSPDIIILNLNLPGLSGKDLLIALISQGIETPVILVAKKGQEGEAIQTFRLGASDYLLWPAREAEVAAVVERVIKKVHERREQQQLTRQLKQDNVALQSRVRELTTILAASKGILSLRAEADLVNRVVETAVRATTADFGWLLLRQEGSPGFILAAEKNCPAPLPSLVNQAWEDGICSLVATSGESLSINGDALRRFKIASFGQSVLIVPIKNLRQTHGLLISMRKSDRPFSPSEQILLEATADYTSIALTNARLIQMQAGTAQASGPSNSQVRAVEKTRSEMLKALTHELKSFLSAAQFASNQLAERMQERRPGDQRPVVSSIQSLIQKISKLINLVTRLAQMEAASHSISIDLTELAQQELPRLKQIVQAKKVSLVAEISGDPITVQASPFLSTQILEGLILNALLYSQPEGQIVLGVERSGDGTAHIQVQDKRPRYGIKDPNRVFERPVRMDDIHLSLDCEGISLALIKDMISQYNGRVWVESKPELGHSFHITLPIRE